MIRITRADSDGGYRELNSGMKGGVSGTPFHSFLIREGFKNAYFTFRQTVNVDPPHVSAGWIKHKLQIRKQKQNPGKRNGKQKTDISRIN